MMKSFILPGVVLLVSVLASSGLHADTLGSASFSSEGNPGSSIAGESSSPEFKSVSEGPGSPIGEMKGNSFNATPGLMEILDLVCASNPSIASKVGDPCSLDDDGDGVPDEKTLSPFSLADNCPFVDNPLQENQDGDDIGDVCDPDLDGDTIANAPDNCPSIANSDQKNFDGDTQGDVCDDDDDNDGLDDIVETDNTDGSTTDPLDADSDDDGVDDGNEDRNADGEVGVEGDPGGAETDPNDKDSDDDGLEDGEEDTNNNGMVDVGETSPLDDDSDNDGADDGNDNCPVSSNSGQENLDGDADGDACDGDSDNDGVLSGLDENDFDNKICRDLDNDQCNDCSVGVDGFGPLADFDVANDGLDTDKDTTGDTLCNVGDPDDDGDGVNDFENDGVTPLDNCPLTPNPGQVDSNNDGKGDACTNPDDGMCFPIKTQTGGAVVICL